MSPAERQVVLSAIACGLDVVNGLHEFLNDDPEFTAASAEHGVTILDVRRPRAKKDLRMPTPESEINLIQTFADTKVIGLTINHEHMTDVEVGAAITLYEAELGIPVTDALTRPTDRLVEMVLQAFPEIAGNALARAT